MSSLYCVRLNAWIDEESASVVSSLREALSLGDGALRVDLESGEVEVASPSQDHGVALPEAEAGPVEVTIRADKRGASGAWYQVSDTRWRYEAHLWSGA